MTEYRIRWAPGWLPFVGGRAFVIWLPLTDHPWMCIPRSRRGDALRLERTKAHEIVHVDQWKQLGRWGFVRRYFFSADGKMELEAEAFAASCNWWYDRGHQHVGTGDALVPVLDYYAKQLYDHYGLDVMMVECRAAIEEHLHA